MTAPVNQLERLTVPLPPYRVRFSSGASRKPIATLTVKSPESQKPTKRTGPEMPPLETTPPVMPERISETKPEPAGEVELERLENIPDVIGALDLRAEHGIREVDAIGGSEEKRGTVKDNIIELRDGTKLRILGTGPGGMIQRTGPVSKPPPASESPAVPKGDFHEEFPETVTTPGGEVRVEGYEQNVPILNAEDLGVKVQPTTDLPPPSTSPPPTPPPSPKRTPRAPSVTKLPTMGFWESWWKRLDPTHRPENLFDVTVIAFHEKFASRQRKNMERAAEEIATMQQLVKNAEKRLAQRKKALEEGTWKPKAGEATQESLDTLRMNLLKLERKQNNRAQSESKWVQRRNNTTRLYMERLEARTDPILGDMDRLQRESQNIQEQLLQEERKIGELREIYRDFVAQGANEKILVPLNNRISKCYVTTNELYRQQRMTGKQQRHMARATAVWTDRQNKLRDLINRKSTVPSAPPQEVTLNPQSDTPPVAAMRSPEPAKMEE